jgi:hypothetical protein
MHVIRWLASPAAAAVLLLASLAPAAARLLIEIDKSAQTMTVSQDGARLHRWPVSTGLPRYATPSGAFTPFRMEKDHFSREWDDAPMPHSIFFTKAGHAIHGTEHLRAIGRPASHGCVRLEPANARVLFDLVKRMGMANTRVVLDGETPHRAPAVARAPGPDERARQGRRPRYDERTRYGQRPGYIDPRGDTNGYPVRPDRGYWVQYPDGRREFVDRDPPPFFFSGPFGPQ